MPVLKPDEFELRRVATQQLREELERRDYKVLGRVQRLMWNRTAPFPEGLNFENESVKQIRSQITKEMLDFSTRTTGIKGSIRIHSATLRIVK